MDETIEIPDTLPGYWIAEWVGNDMVVQPFGEEGHELTNEDCDCRPTVEYIGGGECVRFFTHNAFDGRE